MLQHLFGLGLIAGKKTVALTAEDLGAGAAGFGTPALAVVSPVTMIPGGRLSRNVAVYPAGPLPERVTHLLAQPAGFGVVPEWGAPGLHQVQALQSGSLIAGAADQGKPVLARSWSRNDNAFWAAVA